MPDLQAIVQRMIDAGESEENIATVIQANKQPTNELAGLSSVPAVQRMRDREQQGGVLAGVNRLLEPLAHPQTLGDYASLLIPSEAGARIMGRIVEPAVAGVKKYGGAAVDLATSLLPARTNKALSVLRDLSPSEWNSPLTVAGRDARAHASVSDMVDRFLPNKSGYVPGAQAATSPATALPGLTSPYTGVSDAVDQFRPNRSGYVPGSTAAPSDAAAASAKLTLSSGDVLKLRRLVDQGVPESMAVRILQQVKQGANVLPNP